MVDIKEHIDNINDSIQEELSKIRYIEPSNEWKIQDKGLVSFVKDMDNQDRLLDENQEWFVRDDLYDLQFAHVFDVFTPYKSVTLPVSYKSSYNLDVIFVCVSTKNNAMPVLIKAFENVGTIKISSIEVNTKLVVEKYFIGKLKDWGQNPTYKAFAIKYSVRVPVIQVDYSNYN